MLLIFCLVLFEKTVARQFCTVLVSTLTYLLLELLAPSPPVEALRSRWLSLVVIQISRSRLMSISYGWPPVLL